MGNTLLVEFGEAIIGWWGVSSVALAIVVIALFIGIRFARAIGPQIRQVEQACEKLEETEGEEGFAADFHEIDEALRANPTMEHAWHEFSETLIFPKPEDETEKVRNTQKASAYFNRGSLLGGLNLRFYNALPNLLTGSGIMFTFIGLVVGIGLAGGGLASDDIDQQRQALQQLLGGAALAFVTSIVGLFTSMAFSWYEKHHVHRFDRLCARLTRALDARLERVTPEYLAQENLTLTRQQTRAMESFGDKLAFQIAQAVDEKVTQPMGPWMERLTEAVEGLRSDRESSNEAVLEKMVGQFQESLTGAAGTEMEQLGQTLNELNQGLQNQIETADKRFRENEEASARAMQEMQEVFNGGIAQLRETIDGFSRTLDSVKQLNADSSAIADRLNQMLEQVSQAQQALTETASPLREAADQFGETSQTLKEVGSQIDSASTANSKAVEEIRQVQEQVRSNWQAYQERFDQVDQSLARTFEEIDNGLSRYAQNVQEFITSLDKHTGEIVSSLSGAISELNESVEDLAEANRRAS